MIETPALLIDGVQLRNNITQMQKMADTAGVKLRPHLKTHKSAEIAKLQLAAGASGVTVAKLSEAERMAELGCKDIFIANQITHPLKIERLGNLNRKIDLKIGIDHPEQIDLLERYLPDSGHKLNVLIEIDSGLRRCGIGVNQDLIRLAQKCIISDSLHLSGIFTHAGQVYSARSEEERRSIGAYEGQIMQEAAKMLARENIILKTVSVGSTPTVEFSAFNPAVTEIRPGNYVFYDNIQCSLNACQLEQCALYVLATVISQPASDRIVIDAGSKALGLDTGAHGLKSVNGYGRMVNIRGRLDRLSEEHGVVILEKAGSIRIGTEVLIVPNHACAVVNLYDKYHLIENESIAEMIEIDTRGHIW